MTEEGSFVIQRAGEKGYSKWKASYEKFGKETAQ